MARKTKDVTITAEGRDKGRTYRIVEMSAYDAEKWAARALMAMGRAGVDISDEARAAGAAAIMASGVQALMTMHFEDAEPLLDDMFRCVKFKTDSGVVRDVQYGDEDGTGCELEEVATRLRLRSEVIELHTGFPITAVLSSLGAAAARTDDTTPIT
jgi:hypothetical protein